MSTAKKAPPYHRRQWIVNPAIQFPFVKMMILVLCGMAVASLASVYLAVRITLSAFGLAQDPVIVSIFQVTFWLIMLELVVVTPLVIWIGILMTHKMAGPLVRIYAALAQMSRGSFDVHITLRKGDLLGGLADAINRLADAEAKKAKS